MTTDTPELPTAIHAVAAFSKRREAHLAREHAQTLLEVRRRLERLQTQAAELIAINDRMWAKQGFLVAFNEATDTIVFTVAGTEQRLRLNRADPNVPIQLAGLSTSTGYHAGSVESVDEEEARLRLELEENLRATTRARTVS